MAAADPSTRRVPLGQRLSTPFGFLNNMMPKFHRKSKGEKQPPRDPRKSTVDAFLMDTPTPDVSASQKTTDLTIPSPYDFLQDRPTPVEKPEDLEHLQEALLPSPLDFEYHQKANTPNTVRRNQEEIATLCRDFICSQSLDVENRGISQLAAAAKSSSTLPVPPKSRKRCGEEGCNNLARSRGKCKAHGGGKRCSIEGCSRASQTGNLCIAHGGGKRCMIENCGKAAQSRGYCKGHGGGVRCKAPGCIKSSQGDGFCRSHGGGKRCSYQKCTKWAQRNGMCMEHSGGKYGNSYRGRLQRQADALDEEMMKVEPNASILLV